jgi:alpha-beta hydrolase superfamily lysophospholipase
MKNIIHIPVAIMLFSFTVGCNNDQKQRKMETQVRDNPTKTTTVISNDGTAIAYKKMGQGPSIIVVNGALSHRQSVKDLSAMLSKNFTVIVYDRRGRGESADTKPYAVERERRHRSSC